ncbi:MAG: type II toxin-antitoxin system RelE/ParE family toxin [Thermodesulfobacteriota bacterium]
MRYDIRFLPDVEEDVVAGYRWYEGKVLGLGEEFLRMFYACLEGIKRNPLGSSRVYHEIRRSLLRRFPYAVYFRVQANEVIVFGLFHCARDPRRIESTLIKREDEA